jgi:hypothetical protein
MRTEDTLGRSLDTFDQASNKTHNRLFMQFAKDAGYVTLGQEIAQQCD